MAATKFSDYLGLKDYKKAKKIKHFNHLGLTHWPQSFSKLEIKPCGLGSRIRDVEAEWRLRVITDLISW